MERRRKHKSHQPPQDLGSAITISIFNTQKKLPVARKSIEQLVLFILKEKKVSPRLIAIHLVSKKKISLLHQQFFEDPTPTDCISFPLDEEVLGEVFVCPEVAQEYDPSHPYEETSLYIIHGILHLLGYEDTKEKERRLMHKEQNRLLKLAKKVPCILTSS